MRDPVFPTIPAGTVTIWTGNQWAGGGNAGNQLQDGSTLFFRRVGGAAWTPVPLQWAATRDHREQQVLLGDHPHHDAPRRYSRPVLPAHRLRRSRHDLPAAERRRGDVGHQRRRGRSAGRSLQLTKIFPAGLWLSWGELV